MQHKAYVRAMSCEEICPGVPTQGRIKTPMDHSSMYPLRSHGLWGVFNVTR